MSALVVNAVAVKVEVFKDDKGLPEYAYFRACPVVSVGDGYKTLIEAYTKKVGVTSDSFKYVKNNKVVSTPLEFVEGSTFVCSTSRKGVSVPEDVEGSFKNMLELFVMDVTRSNRLLKTFESTQLHDYDDIVINGLATVL